MTIAVNIRANIDVRVENENLNFTACVYRDGDIRIEISKEDIIRVAKEQFGLVEATDE